MDIKICGSGSLAGGVYDTIKASGAAKLIGEIKCTSLSASGALKGEKIECSDKITVSGAAKFSDLISAKAISVSGALKTNAGINFEE